MDIDALTCSISGPELVQRIDEWRNVASRATSRTISDSSIVSVYAPDGGLVNELRRLINAEKDCCPFMEFEIAETEDRLIVELRVPKEMEHVLAVMLELTTGNAISRASCRSD